jgi:hypothetical protein
VTVSSTSGERAAQDAPSAPPASADELDGARLLQLFLGGSPARARHPKDDWKFPASYLRIGTLDAALTRALAADVAAFDDALWAEANLTSYLSEHLSTVILLQHDERHRLWHELSLVARLEPLFELLEEFYGGGEPVLVCLDRLRGETTIPAHRDGPQIVAPHSEELPSFYRRTHVALTTSDAVEFVVGGERRHLAAGEVFEINNWRVHHVENRGPTDRVHLLVDWNAPATSRRDGR